MLSGKHFIVNNSTGENSRVESNSDSIKKFSDYLTGISSFKER